MKFGFITHLVHQDGENETLDLTLLNVLYMDKAAPKVAIRWWRSKTGDWKDPVFVGDLALEHAEDKLPIMRGIMSSIDAEDDLNDPDSILVKWVREGKAVHVVYDQRAKKHVDVANLTDLDKQSWELDVPGVEEVLNVFAKDEEEAQMRGVQLLVKNATHDAESWATPMAEWFKADKPVSVVKDAKIPTIHPDTAYCKRGHQRAAIEKKVKEKPPVIKAKAE